MQNKDFRCFVKKSKAEYRKIGYVECPAFDGEKVHFTDKGFTHLLRKGRELRPRHIQKQRIKLLKHVEAILKESTTFHTYRASKQKFKTKNGIIDSTAHFWSFEKAIGNRKACVIVCQINKEHKHFLSIMSKN